jgi:hypothetical protein
MRWRCCFEPSPLPADNLPNCRQCIESVTGVEIVNVLDVEVGLEIEERTAAFGALSGVTTSVVGDTMYRSVAWSPTNERNSRASLEEGTTQAFHITLLGGLCICCPDDEVSARAWRDAGGAFRGSDTLFNNEVSISLSDPSQLGPLPPDLYELDPSLTAEALDGPIVGNSRLPANFPPMLRIAQAFCPECRELAAQRNALVRQYNVLRDEVVSLRREGDRQLRVHIAEEGETNRLQRLINPPGATNPDATSQRDFARVRQDRNRLLEANATLAEARSKQDELEALTVRIEALDQQLEDCDKLPCRPDEPVIVTATPSAPATETSIDARVRQTFAAFIGLAFKNSIMSSDVNYVTGGLFGSGNDAVQAAAISFGLLAYPFAGLPVYVSAEGMVFAGADGNFYTVTFHPGPGGDTTAEGRPLWAGRVSVGVTVPVEGGCINRSTCFLVDLEGGAVFEGFRTTFVTDESGGGGQRNVFAFNQTHVGLSLGAAFSMPLCALMEVACSAALSAYGRLNLFPGASESFRVTTSAFGLTYAGGFDVGTQAELGLRLVIPFGMAE